ncbi:succinyldiaminopimelate transaminase [Actinomadura kijaniata]|uniref:succinyldiaminopimelate transaminase n=1 Tax=Actinomadura kijaniata TaxID=46161 RepID=UPI003F1C22F4
MGALPTFPWDRLAPIKRRALEHPGGAVNLAVGEPVDPTPKVVRDALAGAVDAPGYPPTEGTPALRRAASGFLRRSLGADVDPDAVLPAVGTKELVAWLPTLLRTAPEDVVVVPPLAYPTYRISALLAGARVRVSAAPQLLDGPAPKVVWLNSPSNPEGRVRSAAELRELVGWARDRGVLLVNDECYIEYGWEASPVSILHPDVCGGGHEGVLAVHSLSKRSNLAGYRAGFAAGDPRIVRELLAVRKHAGHVVPAPVQAAMIAALDDDEHVLRQRELYLRRRSVLRAALLAAGFRVDHSQASLFLWATRGESCWDTARALAGSGILVAPGDLYGEAGAEHVRVAFTETDERIDAAARRLAGPPDG